MPSLPPLIVRADASARIGAGHLMRGLSLALEWVKRGGRASFVSDCDNPAWRKRVEDAGCAMHAPSELEKAAAGLDDPWIYMDGYAFTAEDREKAQGLGRLLAVFDHGEPDGLASDVVLNQNAGAESRHGRFEPGVLPLLGPRYALLRPEFAAEPPARRPGEAKRVLVSFGGSDPKGDTVRAVAAVKTLPAEVEVVVVLGAANPHEEKIRAAAAGRAGLRLERDADMRALMAWADCAVLAGGVTALEACAMGLPSIVVPIAENQIPGSRALAEAGAAVLASEDLAADLKLLVGSPERLAELSRRARAACDGLGARRVASALAALSSQSADVRVRPAASGDVFDVWRLSNEPAVRANSFQKEAIPLETHVGWYRRQLARDDARFWLLEVGETVAAQVRYTREPDGAAEVHYSVRAAFSGKGLGTEALKRTAREACRELSASTLRGVVIMPNPASERAFEKAGYARAGEKEIQGRKCSVFEKPCS